MLILAGVSIATLTGDNGLLTKASDAKAKTTKAEAREKIQLETAASFDKNGKYSKDLAIENLKKNLGIAEGDIKDNEDGTLTVTLDGYKFPVDKNGKVGDIILSLPTTVAEAIKQKTVFPENKKITDDYGNPVTIPEGFKIADESATYVGGGIVIEDATYEGTIGSQFVWIPVGEKIYKNKEKTEFETIELGRYNFTENSDGTVTTSEYTGDFVEENSNDKSNLKNYGNEIAEDIEAFKASTGVNKNGGYYIGRYEAGLDINSKLDTTDMIGNVMAPNTNWTGWSKQDGTEAQIVCKQGQQVWNYITQNKAAELSRNMYSNDLTFTSDLINSYAWDTAIVFIQKFGEKDNSSTYSYQVGQLKDSNNPSTTGTGELSSTNEVDKQCNIFDMAGNCHEWSTETSSDSFNSCVSRGGRYSTSAIYMSDRGVSFTAFTHSIDAFRPLLYL